MKRLLLCLALPVFLAGCDLVGDDSPPTLDGPYQIKTLAQGSQFTFDITLSESDGTLTGPGTLTIGEEENATTFDLDVSGMHDHPDVHVEMKLTAFTQQVNFDGLTRDEASRVQGTLTFPEGNQQDVVMRSQ